MAVPDEWPHCPAHSSQTGLAWRSCAFCLPVNPIPSHTDNKAVSFLSSPSSWCTTYCLHLCFVYAHVYMHMWVRVHMRVQVYVHTCGGQRTTSGICHPLLFRRSSFVGLKFTYWLGRLTSKLQECGVPSTASSAKDCKHVPTHLTIFKHGC